LAWDFEADVHMQTQKNPSSVQVWAHTAWFREKMCSEDYSSMLPACTVTRTSQAMTYVTCQNVGPKKREIFKKEQNTW